MVDMRQGREGKEGNEGSLSSKLPLWAENSIPLANSENHELKLRINPAEEQGDGYSPTSSPLVQGTFRGVTCQHC